MSLRDIHALAQSVPRTESKSPAELELDILHMTVAHFMSMTTGLRKSHDLSASTGSSSAFSSVSRPGSSRVTIWSVIRSKVTELYLQLLRVGVAHIPVASDISQLIRSDEFLDLVDWTPETLSALEEMFLVQVRRALAAPNDSPQECPASSSTAAATPMTVVDVRVLYREAVRVVVDRMPLRVVAQVLARRDGVSALWRSHVTSVVAEERTYPREPLLAALLCDACPLHTLLAIGFGGRTVALRRIEEPLRSLQSAMLSAPAHPSGRPDGGVLALSGASAEKELDEHDAVLGDKDVDVLLERIREVLLDTTMDVVESELTTEHGERTRGGLSSGQIGEARDDARAAALHHVLVTLLYADTESVEGQVVRFYLEHPEGDCLDPPSCHNPRGEVLVRNALRADVSQMFLVRQAFPSLAFRACASPRSGSQETKSRNHTSLDGLCFLHRDNVVDISRPSPSTCSAAVLTEEGLHPLQHGAATSGEATNESGVTSGRRVVSLVRRPVRTANSVFSSTAYHEPLHAYCSALEAELVLVCEWLRGGSRNDVEKAAFLPARFEEELLDGFSGCASAIAGSQSAPRIVLFAGSAASAAAASLSSWLDCTPWDLLAKQTAKDVVVSDSVVSDTPSNVASQHLSSVILCTLLASLCCRLVAALESTVPVYESAATHDQPPATGAATPSLTAPSFTSSCKRLAVFLRLFRVCSSRGITGSTIAATGLTHTVALVTHLSDRVRFMASSTAANSDGGVPLQRRCLFLLDLLRAVLQWFHTR